LRETKKWDMNRNIDGAKEVYSRFLVLGHTLTTKECARFELILTIAFPSEHVGAVITLHGFSIITRFETWILNQRDGYTA